MLLDVRLGLAQDCQSLEVEETYGRLGPLIGLRSVGTVGIRMRELEQAGWLERVSTGRKRREGSVWRLGHPRTAPAPSGARHRTNRDIEKESSDLAPLPLWVVEEPLTPRLAAPSENLQTTPTAKPRERWGRWRVGVWDHGNRQLTCTDAPVVGMVGNAGGERGVRCDFQPPLTPRDHYEPETVDARWSTNGPRRTGEGGPAEDNCG